MSESETALEAARERAIDALCGGFATEQLSLPELERRLATAQRATTTEELDRLLADLRTPVAVAAPGPGGRVTEPPDPTAVGPRTRAAEPPTPRRARDLVLAFMGGTRRAGRWSPPRGLGAVALMGGIELDFRGAVLDEDGADVHAFAFWGGVEITVPPDVHVDTRGFALLGGFEQEGEIESSPPPGAPVVRVTGLAIMGGVSVKVKERDEGVGKRAQG